MAKAKLIKFDPFSNENITPEIERAKRNARPRSKVYPYHREHKTIAVSVSKDAHARLKSAAKRRGCTMSDLIRPKIEEILAYLDDC